MSTEHMAVYVHVPYICRWGCGNKQHIKIWDFI